jgi:formate dehydrogenase subunit beta
MNSLEKARTLVSEMLTSKRVAGFLALKTVEGHPVPHLFTRAEELGGLYLGDVRYPLTKLLIRLARKYSDNTFGIFARACDERALIELYKNQQFDPEKIAFLGVACSGELAEACECFRPYPSRIDLGEKLERSEDSARVRRIEAMPEAERYLYWMDQFTKCIKCYGCRNICPVCFCPSCTLEDHNLVQFGGMPPEMPVFHLVRAIHMADRCIDCGLCEEACPADIPLRALYRKVREAVKDLFGYLPGENIDDIPPLEALGNVPFEIRSTGKDE